MSDDKDKINTDAHTAKEAGDPADVSGTEKTQKPQDDQTTAQPSQDDATGRPSLQDVIREQVHEGELPFSSSQTLRKILGGDILNTAAIRRQIWLILLITLFAILYISNHYACQQNIIKIDHLQRQLQDAKYKALSSKSQITERSRESNVLNMLQNNKDSVLKIASQPPYIIQVPEEDAR